MKRSKSGDNGKKRHKNWSVLEPGWQGIFVTCPRGKESNCRAELLDLLREYVDNDDEEEDEDEEESGDIEAVLSKEVASLKQKRKESNVEGHLVGCECVVFARLKKADPVEVVKRICRDAKHKGMKQTRYVQRMTPVSLLVTANLDNIEKFTPIVESAMPGEGLKFAIRPTIRNNTKIPRDELISNTAKLVGHRHKVDLKGYDKLVLVECFKSVMGLSVVDEFDELNKFNLTQIYEAAAKAQNDAQNDAE